ncbi:MAG: DUF167 domain-containing protein, partial [Zetaproteobacteria bacterium]
MASIVDIAKDGIYINVHAQPGARRPAVRGIHGPAIKIAVREAAQDGRANAAILAILSKNLGVAKADIELTAGMASRRKRVYVHGEPASLL